MNTDRVHEIAERSIELADRAERLAGELGRVLLELEGQGAKFRAQRAFTAPLMLFERPRLLEAALGMVRWTLEQDKPRWSKSIGDHLRKFRDGLHIKRDYT